MDLKYWTGEGPQLVGNGNLKYWTIGLPFVGITSGSVTITLRLYPLIIIS